jgi:hypothetical protein
MARTNLAPALFDITADIAGALPLDILRDWATSDQENATHKKLLQPFELQGTVVSSDSAGLSRMSRERPLITMMKLISEPKELLHAYGTEIGGRAVGVWFADNSQMFYHNKIKPEDILRQMAAAQHAINAKTLKVGLAIHQGLFYEMGNGLYGADADFVEHTAEEHTSGGEIVVTQVIADQIHKLQNDLIHRHDLNTAMPIHTFDYKQWQALDLQNPNINYPLPFAEEFFADIRRAALDDPEVVNSLHNKYSQYKYILLAKVEQPESDLLLDRLASLVVANRLLVKMPSNLAVQRVKSNGQLGIYTADSWKVLLELAKIMQAELNDAGLNSSFGIAAGDVLIFKLQTGDEEIAGNPVNIASKWAEDAGEGGAIYIDQLSINIDRSALKNWTKDPVEIKTEVSGVELKAWLIS